MTPSEAPTKLQRWLDLIALLVGRSYPITVDEVLERVPAYASPLETDDPKALEASRTMFERDKAELRDLGIPIETVTFTIGGADTTEGYRLGRRDFYLPYLRLVGEARASEGAPDEGAPCVAGVDEIEIAADEARTAREALFEIGEVHAFPLRDEARSAWRKLAFDLPYPASFAAPTLWVERPETDELRDRLRDLTDAVVRRKRVRFRYHGIYRGTSTDRDVAGYGLLFQRGQWYLIGADALREGAIRIFRVDRMEEVAVNARDPRTADYDVPDDFDLARWRDRDAWELGDEEPVRARVAFTFPRSLWAERNGFGEAVEEREDGGAVRAFDVHQVDPFLRWVLSQEGEAEILDPPELRRAFADLVREVAALYRRGR